MTKNDDFVEQISTHWQMHNHVETGFQLECLLSGSHIQLNFVEIFIDKENNFAVIKSENSPYNTYLYFKLNLKNCDYVEVLASDLIHLKSETVTIENLEFKTPR
jgi:hypothetical protein